MPLYAQIVFASNIRTAEGGCATRVSQGYSLETRHAESQREDSFRAFPNSLNGCHPLFLQNIVFWMTAALGFA
jgi:hypothetical protein